MKVILGAKGRVGVVTLQKLSYSTAVNLENYLESIRAGKIKPKDIIYTDKEG